MYDIILIDGNAVGYIEHSATKLNANGMQTQAIFGFIRKLRDWRVRYPSARIQVLWDGQSKRRLALHPTYKSNREKTPEQVEMRQAYAKQKPYLHKLIGALAVPQHHYADYEADDLAGHLVSKLKTRPDLQVLLITGDEDWCQLIRDHISWYDPRKDLTLTLQNLKSQLGYATPYALLEGKCLMGDTSDVIPGVGGLGKERAPLFLAEHGSVTAFWRKIDSGELVLKAKGQKVLNDLASPAGREAFRRNLRLMQLQNIAAPDPSQRYKHPCQFDREAFLAICQELAFMTITRNVDDFIEPFRPKEKA